jgi:hypothetical protein
MHERNKFGRCVNCFPKIIIWKKSLEKVDMNGRRLAKRLTYGTKNSRPL